MDAARGVPGEIGGVLCESLNQAREPRRRTPGKDSGLPGGCCWCCSSFLPSPTPLSMATNALVSTLLLRARKIAEAALFVATCPRCSNLCPGSTRYCPDCGAKLT